MNVRPTIVAGGGRARRWAAVLGLFTLVAVFFSSEIYSYQVREGDPIPYLRALRWSLTDWYVWAAFSPVVFALARRLSPERLGPWRAAAIHLPLSMGFALLHLAATVALYEAADGLTGRPADVSGLFTELLPKTFHFGVATYWVIGGACLGLDVYRRYRERELRAAALEAQLARAQLAALRAQLHPHFLFNTLNTISALVPRDPAAADRMLERLGELLRRTLDAGGAAEVSLADELRFLEGYLEIERTRFGDRLTVVTRVDPDALGARVPNLILQPLVENAIRHGIAPRVAPGRVEIGAEREDGSLRLLVRDNGPGSVAAGGLAEGVGLANTRARLRQLYGDAHRFEVGNAAGGGFEALVVIPYRPAGPDAEVPRAARMPPTPPGGRGAP